MSKYAPAPQSSTKHSHKTRPIDNPQDLALPKTMVQRLAKGVLPSNTRIEKDAITAMSKSATVFVNYLSNGYDPILSFLGAPPTFLSQMLILRW